jgi:Ricin-type beta-trefoil lectin domain-like
MIEGASHVGTAEWAFAANLTVSRESAEEKESLTRVEVDLRVPAMTGVNTLPKLTAISDPFFRIISGHVPPTIACLAFIFAVPVIGACTQAPGLPAADGQVYSIVAVHSGKCLDVDGANTSDDAAVSQWDCHNQANQLWRVQRHAGGRVTILAEHSGKCLSIAHDGPAGAAYAVQRTCRADDARKDQLWIVRGTKDNNINLVSLNGQACLDVEGSDTTAGARVLRFECTGAPNQEWALVPAAVPAI